MNFEGANLLLSFVSSAITILLAGRSFMRYIRLRQASSADISHIEYSFPTLSQLNPDVASTIGGICDKLARFGVPGQEAAKRLHFAAEHFAEMGSWSLAQYLDPLRQREEIEAGISRDVVYLNQVRNILALAPLLFTWGNLWWASTQYQTLFSQHPEAAGVPFLTLWQNAFGTGNGLFTFSTMALIDAFLLLVLLVLSVILYMRERQVKTVGNEALHLLNEAITSIESVQTSAPPAKDAPTGTEFGQVLRRLEALAHTLAGVAHRLEPDPHRPRLAASASSGSDANLPEHELGRHHGHNDRHSSTHQPRQEHPS
jgi:hypothetical protein